MAPRSKLRDCEHAARRKSPRCEAAMRNADGAGLHSCEALRRYASAASAERASGWISGGAVAIRRTLQAMQQR